VEQTPMLYLVCIIGSQSASITNSFWLISLNNFNRAGQGNQCL
jgi:hypothetical protein